MAEPVIPAESPLFDTNQTHTTPPSGPQLSDGFVLNEVPTSAIFNYMFNVVGEWTTWLKLKLALFPGYAADSTLTIAAGSVTPTAGNHAIETTGGGATSDLSNIVTTNLDAGRMLVISCLNPSHIVVVKHLAGGAGQIHLNNALDYSLNSLSAILTLKRVGADWYEVSRSIQVAAELPGVIKAYGGSSAPGGYLLCDGSPVSRSTYATLYGVVGNAFGSGDGSTTFNIPNMMGRFPRGLANYADATCSALPGSNNATFTTHPYKQTGVRVRLTGGTMGGLAANTDYWLIYIDANTLAFATTLANAIAGTKISISANAVAVISQWEDPDATARASSTVGAASGRAVGSLQADDIKSHSHAIRSTQVAGGGSGESHFGNNLAGNTTEATGNNETRPFNVAVNYIIKT